MLYPFNNAPLGILLPQGGKARYNPKGAVAPHGARKNPFSPAKLDTTPSYAARLFVGLSVHHVPTYTVEQVVKLTQAFLHKMRYAEDASFISQRGICTITKADDTKETINENSVQIVIFKDPPAGEVWFRRIVRNLAQHLCRIMKQEWIILDYQKNGLSEYIWYVTK